VKFRCVTTRAERLEVCAERAEAINKKGWARWFAWHPIKMGALDCRWLEWVERKPSAYVDEGYYDPSVDVVVKYEYREVKS
jgi:hypothetical protein